MTTSSAARIEQRRAPVRAPWWVAGGVLAAVGADLAFDPVHTHVPLCPFHAVTGWWCPLCGGLRSAYSLAHGQWGAALRDNVLFVAALPLLALYWLDWAARARRGVGRRPLSRTAVAITVVLAVAFTVVRNLGPLALLRPS